MKNKYGATKYLLSSLLELNKPFFLVYVLAKYKDMIVLHSTVSLWFTIVSKTSV